MLSAPESLSLTLCVLFCLGTASGYSVSTLAYLGGSGMVQR